MKTNNSPSFGMALKYHKNMKKIPTELMNEVRAITPALKEVAKDIDVFIRRNKSKTDYIDTFVKPINENKISAFFKKHFAYRENWMGHKGEYIKELPGHVKLLKKAVLDKVANDKLINELSKQK